MTKRGLPLWSKILISIVVISISATIASAFSFFMFIQQVAKDSIDPQSILVHSQAVANFPEPLPDGFKYLMAADLLFMTLIAIEHLPDKQEIFLYCIKGNLSEEPKKLLDRAYDVGINTIHVSAKFHDLKSRGKETVAGIEMPYILGDFIDQTGRSATGMVGCICVNKAAKNILIYSYPAPGSAYNQSVTVDLLKSIKGF